MKKIKWYHILIYLCFAFSILIVSYSMFAYRNDSVKFKDNSIELLSKGWKYINNDGKEKNIEIPNKLNVKKDEKTVIIRKIPNKNLNDMAVLFSTYHTFVKVYADNELIYSYGKKKELPFGNTPGSLWNLVEISSKYKGKELKIELTSPYNKYSGKIPKILYGSRADLLLYTLKRSLPLMIFSIIPFAFGVIALVFFFVFYKLWGSLKLLNLSILLIISSLWGLSESKFFQFYFGNAFATEVATFLFLAMVLMATSILLKEIGIIKDTKKFKLYFLIDFAVYVIINVLQLLNIADYFNTLFLVHSSSILTCIFISIDVYKNMLHHKKKVFSKYFVYGFSILFVCGILDTLEFYLYDVFGNGFFLRIGLLLFMIFIGIWYMKTYINMAKENIEKTVYEKLAYTDPLTLKKNRRAFNKELLTLKETSKKGTIIFADINNLKVINDTYGHEEGDKAIIIVSKALERFTDIYRLGGDEFCVIAREKGKDEVKNIINDIVLDTELLTKNNKFKITLAYGYEEYDANTKDINDVVNKADKNMYINKKRIKENML